MHGSMQQPPQPPTSSSTLQEALDPWQEGPVARAERELLAAKWRPETVAHIVSEASGVGHVPAAAINVESPDFGPDTSASRGGLPFVRSPSHQWLHDHLAQWYREDPVYALTALKDTAQAVKDHNGPSCRRGRRRASTSAT